MLIAAIAMLFTTRYPPGLFDFAVGINRWGYRLLVYVALMTDRYPPFRLDQGSIDIEGPAQTSGAQPAEPVDDLSKRQGERGADISGIARVSTKGERTFSPRTILWTSSDQNATATSRRANLTPALAPRRRG